MYRLALLLLAPYALYYTVRRSLRDGGWRYFKQRLGLNLPRAARRPLWAHCASVGEVHAAAPLLEAVQARYPSLPILVTTNTPTGALALRQRLAQSVGHCYLPIDWQFATRAFVTRVRPLTGLVLETELWPHLFARCGAAGVGIVVINGRLSQRSLGAPLWSRRAQRDALQRVTAVLARNDTDARRFLDLGARPGSVEALGNLKFAADPARSAAAPPFIARPYWLAASTHAPEEEMCAGIQLADGGLPLLVIAPRYPDRGKALADTLRRLGAEVALRSRQENVTAATQVYIADTLGELGTWFAHAHLAVMGGSFAPRGGQNLLEAARHGCPVVVGPHMDNFADETQRLLSASALLQVDGAEALQAAVAALCADPERRDALRAALLETMRAEAHVLERYLRRLQQLWADTGVLDAFE